MRLSAVRNGAMVPSQHSWSSHQGDKNKFGVIKGDIEKMDQDNADKTKYKEER